MDIIDIMLAKAMTPQGQISTYAQMAQVAVSRANTAMQNITSITEQTNTNNTNAETALANANAALSTVESALSDLEIIDEAAIDDRLGNLALELSTRSITGGFIVDLITNFPDSTTKTTTNLIKYYTSLGQNTDGTMTQKAISDAIAANSSTVDLGSTNQGKIVTIDEQGRPTASSVTESDLLDLLVANDKYEFDNAVGVEIDYVNKTVTRVQNSTNYNAGTDFDGYTMFGGRRRCILNDAGTVVAWYGDSNYIEDGTLGQVMVYQPKFYYYRNPTILDNGKIIRKEVLLLSATEQPGFKIHPLFVKPDGTIMDGVYIGAYESCAQVENTYDTSDSVISNLNSAKLASIAGVKPISGANKQFTTTIAETMAKNRGNGWHITNLQVESALQMLQIVEFGSMNMQSALEDGIVNLTSVASTNTSSNTGSTTLLGNISGHADSTTNITNNKTTTYNAAGTRAISYRGMENPWGNTWRMVGGANVIGNGVGAGTVYICTDFNYTPNDGGSNYVSVNFSLSANSDWISAFGYGNSTYDWVFLPIEANNANSALPVGDNFWVTTNLTGINAVLCGGSNYFGSGCGPFTYAFDQSPSVSGRCNNARLMYVG